MYSCSQQPSEDPSPPTPPQPSAPRRPTILQRLHLHSHSKKQKPKPPTLQIERPTTSSSLPVARSTSQTRPRSSHSTDAATIAEITQSMPQSLDLGPLDWKDRKRQRSRDSRKAPSDVGSQKGSQKGVAAGPTDTERLARSGIRFPAYLNKSRQGKSADFELAGKKALMPLSLTRNRDPICVPGSGMETTLPYSWCATKPQLTLQGR